MVYRLRFLVVLLLHLFCPITQPHFLSVHPYSMIRAVNYLFRRLQLCITNSVLFEGAVRIIVPFLTFLPS